jgi:aspartate/tyrosine/aromatic aminotransferase
MNIINQIKKLDDFDDDKIFSLVNEYKDDNRDYKINLTIGVLVEDNKLFKFNVVKEEEDKCKTHGYLSISGNFNFIKLHYELVTGSKYKDELVYQTLSGTGAISLAAKVLSILEYKDIYIPSSTWGNHNNIFKSNNFNIKYYDYITKPRLDKDKLLQSLSKINNSLVLFQSCCHNPTGVDIENETWDKIVDLMKQNNNIVIIDNAYQGLVSGNLNEDNYSIKKFLSKKIPSFICSSHSKNFGLYGQRIGGLIINIDNNKLNNYIKKIIRSEYSTPPYYGSYIVENILSNDVKYNLWTKEVYEQVNKLKKIRVHLYSKLRQNGILWHDIMNTNGLFYQTNLTVEQVKELKVEYGIYMLENGRINLAALNNSNMCYFVNSVKKILK